MSEITSKLAAVGAKLKEQKAIVSGESTEQNEATETRVVTEESTQQSQTSNRDTYVPNPENLDGITLSEELLKLREKMAENNHEVWVGDRINAGWKYGNEKDVAKRTTPCLVPYSSLPDAEKAYYRHTAMETLKLIIKLGYRIEPESK